MPASYAQRYKNLAFLFWAIEFAVILNLLYFGGQTLLNSYHASHWKRVDGAVVAIRDVCKLSNKPLLSKYEKFREIYCDDEAGIAALRDDGWKQDMGRLQELTLQFHDEADNLRTTVLIDRSTNRSAIGAAAPLRFAPNDPGRTELVTNSDNAIARGFQLSIALIIFGVFAEILRRVMRRAAARAPIS